jgi:hypothetical protein
MGRRLRNASLHFLFISADAAQEKEIRDIRAAAHRIFKV